MQNTHISADDTHLEPGEEVSVPLYEIGQLVDERAPRRRIRLAPFRAVLEGLAGSSNGLN